MVTSQAFPYVYTSLYGMSRQETGLVFLAPWTGNLLGVLVYFVFLKPCLRARRNQVYSQSCGKREIAPEARLPGVLLASLFTPIGMFWFALAARPTVPCVLTVLSGIPIGMGMTLMQLSLLNYYIDLYPTRSASVVAANCAVRNVAATVFPSVAVPLYSALGVWHASVALACVSCVGFPAGVVLLAYGKRLRARSRWATQDALGVSEPAPAPAFGGRVVPKYVDMDAGAVAPLLGSYVVQAYGGTSQYTP